MRNLASIQKITSIEQIKDADRIEKASVLGWEVVVKKDEFRVGDLCIYCEIDSILPQLPIFEFLRDKKFRIKTQKLRGIYSQGICFPISIIKEIDKSFDLNKLKENDDVTYLLGVKKYDPDEHSEDLSIKKSWFQRKFGKFLYKLGFKGSKKNKNPFPSYLCPKSDETRVNVLQRFLFSNENEKAFISEKLEGSSSTFIFNKKRKYFGLFGKQYDFYVCSRNLIIKDEKDKLNLIAKKYDLENKLKKYNKNIAIQAEFIGPGIQKNIYQLKEHDIRIFNIYDIGRKQYCGYDEFIKITKDLQLETVPILDENHLIHSNIKDYINLSKGKSKLNQKILREGIVIRGKEKDISFKAINPEYLLKFESE